MATITLTGDTNYSALSVANGDTIDCAGFVLTLDVQPTETGVQVTSPGTNGRVVFSDGWNLSTWDFFAGASTTAGMISTLPSGATIKSMTAGASTNAYGINTNNGTVISLTSGSGSAAVGILTNNGTVTTATGGSGGGGARCVFTNSASGVITTLIGGPSGGATGCNTNNGTIGTATASGVAAVETNNGTITTATGGSASAANGCNTNSVGATIASVIGGSANNANGCNANNGTITTATGGSANGAHGVSSQNGTVLVSIGGSAATAHGINLGIGFVLRVTDNTGRGLASQRGSAIFVEGPHIAGVIPDNIKTIYSLGALSGSATIAGDATVITLSEGTGGASFPPIGPGGLVF
jgi:hypothetical protein